MVQRERRRSQHGAEKVQQAAPIEQKYTKNALLRTVMAAENEAAPGIDGGEGNCATGADAAAAAAAELAYDAAITQEKIKPSDIAYDKSMFSVTNNT